MPRAIWTGTLQFVLISFPVKLYKATDDKGVSFKNLHSVCGSPISQKKWCNVCGQEVLPEEINKGFEVGKGQYVIFSEDEIDNALPESVKAIKIEAAVYTDEIPVITYETSYFMAPDKGGEHVYNLLFNALAIKGKVLIGRLIIRNKEHLVAIRPYQDGLLLSMLHFNEDVRDMHEVILLKEKQVDKKELELAVNLMDHLTSNFKDINQEDAFRKYIEETAELKATGQTITIEPIKPVAQVKNIVEGLQKSIEMVSGGQKLILEKKPEKEEEIIKVKEDEIIKVPIKKELEKMYGVTEEELNKIMLEKRIEDEEERLNNLKELIKYKTFEDYLKSHMEEFEGIEVSNDLKILTIPDETYPRIKLPVLKKIGIVAEHYKLLIYMKSAKKEIKVAE